jgi:hypothetical protein
MRKDFEIDSEIIIDDVRENLPDEGSLQVNGNTADIPSGVIPLASTAVGQKLKVYASKTRAQALSLTGANPQALFFPTDAESIVFNGKEYVAGPYYVNTALANGTNVDLVLSRVGKPSDLFAAVLAGRPVIGWYGTSIYKKTELYPISVKVSSSSVYLTWTEHYRGNRIELRSAVLNYTGENWTSCKLYEYRFSEGIYTPPAE